MKNKKKTRYIASLVAILMLICAFPVQANADDDVNVENIKASVLTDVKVSVTTGQLDTRAVSVHTLFLVDFACYLIGSPEEYSIDIYQYCKMLLYSDGKLVFEKAGESMQVDFELDCPRVKYLCGRELEFRLEFPESFNIIDANTDNPKFIPNLTQHHVKTWEKVKKYDPYIEIDINKQKWTKKGVKISFKMDTGKIKDSPKAYGKLQIDVGKFKKTIKLSKKYNLGLKTKTILIPKKYLKRNGEGEISMWIWYIPTKNHKYYTEVNKEFFCKKGDKKFDFY